jgi:hypothetical protein
MCSEQVMHGGCAQAGTWWMKLLAKDACSGQGQRHCVIADPVSCSLAHLCENTA